MRIEGISEHLTEISADPQPKTQKDEFLRLFVAQLENQDPLDPQDGAEFVSQLAQFAALEQSQETNDRLAALGAEQSAASRAALVSLTGHDVVAQADSFTLDPSRGALPAFSASLPTDATRAQLIVRDASGAEIRSIDLGAQSAGPLSLSWDGLDQQGVAVEEGRYSLEVVAVGPGGDEQIVPVEMHGTIGAVAFGFDGTLLHVGGVGVTPSQIVSLDNDSQSAREESTAEPSTPASEQTSESL